MILSCVQAVTVFGTEPRLPQTVKAPRALGGLLDPGGIVESATTHIATPEEVLRDYPAPTPAAVDNSAGLPPVGNQGSQASCSAWAIGYYHATYIENRETPVDLTDPDNQVSPAYLYNLANCGYNYGSDMNDIADLIISNGACSMAEMPYDSGDLTSWPDEDWIWVSGMTRKAVSKTWLQITQKPGMDALKAYLAAGNTAVTHIQVYENFDYIENYNYVYSSSERTGTDRGGHAVAICGYDDTKLTADGLGALRMVNSWGTGWGEDGYWWLSYGAIKDSSICYGRALYLTSEVNYEPKMVVKAKLDHPLRGDIVTDFGLSVSLYEGGTELASKSFLCCPELEAYLTSYSLPLQQYPFPAGKMAFDMTEFLPLIDPLASHDFQLLLDNKGSTAGTLVSLEALNAEWWEGGLSWDAPLAITGSAITEAHAWVTPGVFQHMPIRADSDLDMEHQAIGEFWEGDGSAYSPYVVHEYIINGSEYGYCIYVGNTTSHFLVDSCYLHNASGFFSWPYYYESGIHLFNAHNGLLFNNNLSENAEGIFLYSSSHNTVSNNEIYLNFLDGIIIWSAENNTVLGNSVINNDFGLLVNAADNNVIKENNITDSDYGIFIASSTGNQIFHNNFINNNDTGDSGTNSWDNGYPSGGNYWSDYSDADLMSGPLQNIPGPDGIGDVPYLDILGGTGAVDHYPLMAPWTPPPVSFFNISLNLGWNLISIPLELEDSSITNVLASISGKYVSVKAYDTLDFADPWKSYRQNGTVNDLVAIDNTVGVWVHATEGCTLAVSGYEPTTTAVMLYAGWNLVGYPSLVPMAVQDALFGVAYDRIECFDPVSPYIREMLPPEMMMPGAGYWIHVPADTLWVIDW